MAHVPDLPLCVVRRPSRFVISSALIFRRISVQCDQLVRAIVGICFVRVLLRDVHVDSQWHQVVRCGVAGIHAHNVSAFFQLQKAHIIDISEKASHVHLHIIRARLTSIIRTTKAVTFNHQLGYFVLVHHYRFLRSLH